MKLSRLTIVHVRKTGHPLPKRRATRDAGIFCIETCLRLVWVGLNDDIEAAGLAHRFDGTVMRGVEAYRQLLEIGCGLESEIPGESEVFGQLRAGWQRFQSQTPEAARALDGIIQRLLEDIKDIRTRHLQGHGGASYGSLMRLLLGEDAQNSTLVVGAGKMAQAILPYLTGRPLLLWNRTPQRLEDLLRSLGPNTAESSDIRLLPNDPEVEIAAWASVGNIVLCVPPDAQQDRLRLAAWHARQSSQSSGRTPGRLIHLGILTTEGTAWEGLPSLSTLQDLFNLRALRDEMRVVPLARARSACREKAQLRGLGGPTSLAHGWEDLSLFTLSA